MHFSRRILCDYTPEIANLDYTIYLDNNVSFHLIGSNLIAFIKTYIPEINIDSYYDAVYQEHKRIQSYELANHLRFKFDNFFKEFYSSALSELDFDASYKDGYCGQGYAEMMKNDNLDKFFTVARKTFIEIEKGGPSFTHPILLNDQTWVFNESSMSVEDAESSFVIKEKTLQEIIKYIAKDFAENGENTIKQVQKKKNRSVSLDFFLENFEKDLSKFERSDFSYENFCALLHKYKLPEEPIV